MGLLTYRVNWELVFMTHIFCGIYERLLTSQYLMGLDRGILWHFSRPEMRFYFPSHPPEIGNLWGMFFFSFPLGATMGPSKVFPISRAQGILGRACRALGELGIVLGLCDHTVWSSHPSRAVGVS